MYLRQFITPYITVCNTYLCCTSLFDHVLTFMKLHTFFHYPTLSCGLLSSLKMLPRSLKDFTTINISPYKSTCNYGATDSILSSAPLLLTTETLNFFPLQIFSYSLLRHWSSSAESAEQNLTQKTLSRISLIGFSPVHCIQIYTPPSHPSIWLYKSYRAESFFASNQCLLQFSYSYYHPPWQKEYFLIETLQVG